jgi:hypothetical protein
MKRLLSFLECVTDIVDCEVEMRAGLNIWFDFLLFHCLIIIDLLTMTIISFFITYLSLFYILFTRAIFFNFINLTDKRLNYLN